MKFQKLSKNFSKNKGVQRCTPTKQITMKYFSAPYTAESLKSQYRKLSFIHHPDAGGSNSSFVEMSNEYEKLLRLYVNTSAEKGNYFEKEYPFSKIENKLGWEITESPIMNQKGEKIEGYKAIFGQNGAILNVCKDSYTPTTNYKFCEMVDYLANFAESNETDYITFENGKKVLAFVKIKRQNIAGFDYDKYLLVGNAHDSSSAFFVGVTQSMIRCTNQFTERNRQLKAWHTSNHEGQLLQIKSIFKNYNEQNKILSQKIESFAAKKINAETKNNFIKHCLDVPFNVKIQDLSTRKQNQIYAFNDAILREVNEIGQNAFGLFEGATYYATHILRSKQSTFGNVFGAPADINGKAMAFCEAL